MSLALPSRESGQDVVSAAISLSRRGQSLADRLEGAALSGGSSRALNVAANIRACAAPDNVWTARDLHHIDTGELFDGFGTFAQCNSRLCPFCAAAMHRRLRKRARVAIDSIEPRSKERWQFITLTMPTLEGESLLNAIRLFQRSWSLLRMRKTWRECVRGGVKGMEWTVSNFGRGYHVHAHLLVCGRSLEKRLQDDWGCCVAKMQRERGCELGVVANNDFARVDCNTVKMEESLTKCAKYVCKPEVWDGMSDTHLLEAVEVQRWPRLFEVLGTAHRFPHSTLDITELSVGEGEKRPLLGRSKQRTEHSTAIEAHSGGKHSYLADRFEQRRELRKLLLSRQFPYAKFEALSAVWVRRKEA